MNNKQLTYLKGFAQGKGYYEMLKALNVAERLHEGQKRKGGGDYIEHPVYVANTLTYLGLTDEVLLTSSLLHDVVEDCDVTKEELRHKHHFNKDTVKVVSLVTKTPEMTDDEYYEGIMSDIRAILLKLVDRCHNISTMMGAFSNEKMKDYVAETRTRIIPLCKYAIRHYPQYSNEIYLIRNHIESIMVCVEGFLKIEDNQVKAEVKQAESPRCEGKPSDIFPNWL